MPGAWEEQKPTVLVATLTRETVTTMWARAYRLLAFPPGGDFMFMSGAPFDHARNLCVKKCLDMGFSHLFFLDDDIVLPWDAILRLMNRNLDIVSGIYYRRHPPILPVMLKDTPPNPQYLGEGVTFGDLIEADLVGAGCLLIKRHVLEAMRGPTKERWFDWRCDWFDRPEYERCSEDFAFCREAKKLGFKIHVDTGVQAIHGGHASVVPPGKVEIAQVP